MSEYSKQEIEKCLRHLRRGHDYSLQVWYIKKLQENLNALGMSLEDVNCSEEEIQRFKKCGHIISSLDIINTLRCGASIPEIEMITLRGHMTAANLSYQELGITEEKVTEFAKKID